MGEDINRKYCVRIKNGDYGRKWYNGKGGEVYLVTISDNPNAGYSVVSDDANRVRVIEKEHAELVGPVGDFEREDRVAKNAEPVHDVSTEKHVIELARRVVELRRELDVVTANVQTFAETATSADYKAGQAMTTSAQFADRIDALGELYDRNTDDIIMLDERTQPLTREGISKLSTELAEVVTKTITGAMSNGD